MTVRNISELGRILAPQSPSGPDTGGATLREAARRAALTWREALGTALDPADAAELPQALVAAITDHPNPTGSVDVRLRSVAGRRLLSLVRGELVRMWSATDGLGAAGQMLATLQAIESVQAAVEPDTTEDLVERLSAIDGPELLVEVAHDLRSPLTSILFLAETLQRRLSGDINELQHRQLRLIYSAALGLSEMTSNVLELMRGGTNLAEDESSPFSVKEILDSVSDITKPMAEEKGLMVRVHHPSMDHRIGRQLALSRVLLNLTTNALKFTDEGFVEIVARDIRGNWIEFSVRDSGRGINPNALETLFSPFRKVKRGKGTTFSGTGLGLALCRKLVEAMGSKLKLETKPNWGTRFYFELELPPVSRE